MKRSLGKYWDSTGLLPDVIAECTVGRDKRTCEVPLLEQDRLVALLVERANRVVQHNPGFARRLNTRSNLGRDRFYGFMQHWLDGLLLRGWVQ